MTLIKSFSILKSVARAINPTLGFESSAYFGSIFTECIIFKTNITLASKYSSKLRRN
jgi:hypothetical protein